MSSVPEWGNFVLHILRLIHPIFTCVDLYPDPQNIAKFLSNLDPDHSTGIKGSRLCGLGFVLMMDFSQNKHVLSDMPATLTSPKFFSSKTKACDVRYSVCIHFK